MKSLWNALSVFLLLNVLAVLLLLGWLSASDRLDRERLYRVRDLFSRTVAQEKQEEEVARRAEEEAQHTAEQLAHLEAVAAGPTTLAARLRDKQQTQEIAMLHLERLQRAIADLRARLESDKAELARQKAEIDAQRKALEDAMRRREEQARSEDFQRALETYEQLKPKQAKEHFQELIRQGKQEQVIDYLAAMQLRKAAAVLREFKLPAETVQATELLETLRQRGVTLDNADATKGDSTT